VPLAAIVEGSPPIQIKGRWVSEFEGRPIPSLPRNWLEIIERETGLLFDGDDAVNLGMLIRRYVAARTVLARSPTYAEMATRLGRIEQAASELWAELHPRNGPENALWQALMTAEEAPGFERDSVYPVLSRFLGHAKLAADAAREAAKADGGPAERKPFVDLVAQLAFIYSDKTGSKPTASNPNATHQHESRFVGFVRSAMMTVPAELQQFISPYAGTSLSAQVRRALKEIGV